MWTKWEGTPMERKLGLYVTPGDDGSLKRTLVSISGETELEATTLNDEVILFSELIFDFYAFIVDRIRLSAAYLVTQDGDGKDTVDIAGTVSTSGAAACPQPVSSRAMHRVSSTSFFIVVCSFRFW